MFAARSSSETGTASTLAASAVSVQTLPVHHVAVIPARGKAVVIATASTQARCAVPVDAPRCTSIPGLLRGLSCLHSCSYSSDPLLYPLSGQPLLKYVYLAILDDAQLQL